GNEPSLLDCAYKNYTEPTYQCDTPATAACVSAEEVLIYVLSLVFSCVFCCCSIMVLVLMCLVIASCPLALLVNNQNNGRNSECRNNRGEDPSQPLLIANPYSKEKAPPTYTN
ncbi:hypothetical protein, partial [Salmonella sp. s51228]|uniref:hypothetical protein n=1 Tax=Salmonella sp. s51228 TaxID=3159652 RepID=UPI00397F1902